MSPALPLAMCSLALLAAAMPVTIPATAQAAAQRAFTRSDSAVRSPAGAGTPAASVGLTDGVPTVPVNELARLLGATKFWRPDVRRLLLRAGDRRLTLTTDNPFVLVDDHLVRLDHDVVSRGGELQVPVELVRLLPDGWPRLTYDVDAAQVRLAPAAGAIGSPRVDLAGAFTALVVPTDYPEAVMVVGRARERFRLRLAGDLTGVLPRALPDEGLVRGLAVSPLPGGIVLEVTLAPETIGWRLDRSSGRVVLTLARSAAEGFEPFSIAAAGPGPGNLHTIVLDPGHGGFDLGAQAEGLAEKDLTLALARLVAGELGRRSDVRVVLTRTSDRDLSQDERAEMENQTQPDAVISIHFDALEDSRAHGTAAWCPPAAPGVSAASAASLLSLLPWRDAATSRAAASRGLAESMTGALDRAGFGPGPVRERLPLALVGVQSPGVLLDCGALSNPDDRARILAPSGMHTLAVAIADGIAAWQRRHE